MDTVGLRLAAKMYDDAQRFRIGQENKVRSGTVDGALVDALVPLREFEDILKKVLKGTYRREVPAAIRDWQKGTLGIGEHLMARLLGVVGHPRIAQPYHWEGEGIGSRHLVEDEPYERTVSQLWQYAGHGAPGRRQTGMDKADAMRLGNPEAKMIVYLMAKGIVMAGIRPLPGSDEKKSTSDYAQLYLDTKHKYSMRTHTAPCPGGVSASSPTGRSRCKVGEGKNVHYAEVGDSFAPGHINAIAMRRVGKELLKDLWIVANDV